MTKLEFFTRTIDASICGIVEWNKAWNYVYNKMVKSWEVGILRSLVKMQPQDPIFGLEVFEYVNVSEHMSS